jgi:hypothetical protein
VLFWSSGTTSLQIIVSHGRACGLKATCVKEVIPLDLVGSAAETIRNLVGGRLGVLWGGLVRDLCSWASVRGSSG